MAEPAVPTMAPRSPQEQVMAMVLGVAQGALLHGSGDGLHQPHPHLTSGNTAGNRASQLQHAVQNIDGDTNFGSATLVFMEAQPIADHLFISADGGLHPATCGVARRLLPADPAFIGNAL